MATSKKSTQKKGARTAGRAAAAGKGAPAAGAARWERVESLTQLVERLGSASEDEVAPLVGHRTTNELIEAGAQVDTLRIDDDALSNYAAAAAFFATASSDLQAIVLLDAAVVRIGAWAALQGQQAYIQFARTKVAHRTVNEQLAATAEACRQRARTYRDRAAEALRGASGQDDAILARIQVALRPEAAGQVETGPEAAVDALVAIGQDLLSSEHAATRQACALFRVTEPVLDDWAAVAAAARKAVDAAAAPRAGRPVTQADVDRWDGINLIALERVVRAFATAHAVDHRVPRLAWSALRGLYGVRRSTKGAKAPKGAAAGVPAGAPGAGSNGAPTAGAGE